MDVRARLNDLFRKVFEDDAIVIRNEMTAADVPQWDSLAHIGLIMEIEEEFQIQFTVDDLVGLKDVGEMIDLIERKSQMRR
jgi:acyl carrier protein